MCGCVVVERAERGRERESDLHKAGKVTEMSKAPKQFHLGLNFWIESKLFWKIGISVCMCVCVCVDDIKRCTLT